jgi:hypothetical protein
MTESFQRYDRNKFAIRRCRKNNLASVQFIAGFQCGKKALLLHCNSTALELRAPDKGEAGWRWHVDAPSRLAENQR